MTDIVDYLVFNAAYEDVFAVTLIYFMTLYFGLAPLFLGVCQLLERWGLVNKINPTKLTRDQAFYEMKHSLVSILVFGLSGVVLMYFIRVGLIALRPNTTFNVTMGLIALTVWNELHFFVVHRLMHLPFFMRRVHAVHHRSHVPSVFSVYSFHWFESLLLSTVPLTLATWMLLPSLSILIFPVMSLLLNLSGHCNYRFGTGLGGPWWTFGSRHNDHHQRGTINFGFVTHLFDHFFGQSRKDYSK